MNYYEVFTPGAPPSSDDLLIGRDGELEELRAYWRSPGCHPIVVGQRGVGKTSLVQRLLRDYEIFTQIEANTVSSFDELTRCILEDLEIDTTLLTVSTSEDTVKEAIGKAVIAEGRLEHTRSTAEDRKAVGADPISPQRFKRYLINHKKKAAISIDELDDLSDDSDIPERLAQFAKSVSSQANQIQAKFIFSGIGRDAHSLFKAHLSSNRNLPVLHLQPLNQSHLRVFLNQAQNKTEREIPAKVVNELVSDADGFPYYVHQVGYHMFRALELDANSTELKFEHYIKGRREAFKAAFSHYLNRYKFTIYNLNQIHFEIFRRILSSRIIHHPYFPIEDHLVEVLRYDRSEVKQAFRHLTNNCYLNYRQSDRTISFYDALLRPFIRAKLKIDVHDNQPQLL